MRKFIIFAAVAAAFCLASCKKDTPKGNQLIISYDSASLEIGQECTFRDESVNGASRIWEFEDASVKSSMRQEVTLAFNAGGIKHCSIEVTFTDGSSETREFLIDVAMPEPGPGPEPDPYEGWKKIGDLCVMSDVTIVNQPSGTMSRGYWPDSKLIPVKKGDKWQMFWAEAVDVMTEAGTPWPEDHVGSLRSTNAVFGKGFSSIHNCNENGSWFIGIHQHGAPGHYIGFFHGESHWSNDGVAFKTIGVAYSDDYGKNWHDAAPILTDDDPKGETEGWTGLGDGCVIWDQANKRYLCYYQSDVGYGKAALCMAASYDPEGASGTWKKWDGKDFTLEGYNATTTLGGKNIEIPNLERSPGANPSVMWNTYLNKWVMAYHTWNNSIVISTSEDAINWEAPKTLIFEYNSRNWYPNLISEDGDLIGGKEIRLYYAHHQDLTTGVRDIGCRTIVFK